MKSALFFGILLSLIVNTALAQVQNNVPAFGKVDIADLTMNDCNFAPGASAIHLLKYEEVTLSVFPNGTNQVVTLTRCRTKILKKSGFKYASIVINYGNNDTKITDVEGVVYNLDDAGQIKISPVDKSDIYKSVSKKSKSIRFTFPALKEGSVFEYQFTRKDKSSYFVPSWYFQSSIPTLLSMCKITRPYASMLQKRVVGDQPVEEDSVVEYAKGSEQKLLTNYYSMKKVPAFARKYL